MVIRLIISSEIKSCVVVYDDKSESESALKKRLLLSFLVGRVGFLSMNERASAKAPVDC